VQVSTFSTVTRASAARDVLLLASADNRRTLSRMRTGLRSRLIAIVAVVAASMASADSAGADIRGGTYEDGLDQQATAPSFDPRPAKTEIIRVFVEVDRGSGTISAAVSINQPPGSLDVAPEIRVLGAASCAGDPSGKQAPALQIRFENGYYNDPPGESAATLKGVGGVLTSPTQRSPDRLTTSVTFAHALLKNRDWRCAAGTGASDDGFTFYFPGFEPKVMSPASARVFLDSELTRRFGASWSQAGSRRWLICPRVEMTTAEDLENIDDREATEQAICQFRLPAGSKTREGSALLKLVDGDFVVDYFSVGKPFGKELRTCRIRRALRSYTPPVVDRSLRAGGYVGCYDGAASMIRDLHYAKPGRTRVGFHGTNRAGFEAAVRFNCTLRARPGGGRTATCANSFGDRFVYRYRVLPRRS
jgi:hypothetical protein